MIFGKLWRSLKAQLNKLANVFAGHDPIAQMQYEYDSAVDQLKDGREGLEQYRALVERVSRQVQGDSSRVGALETKVKAYLQAGDRESAARVALELKKAQEELNENRGQLEMHEAAYQNNLTKIKHASSKLAELKDKISNYDADLKMSRAEAELARLASSFNFDMTTDFGQVEQLIQDQIDRNRSAARVAADLSGEGTVDIEREQAMEKMMADEALRDFEMRSGLVAAPADGAPESPAPAATNS
jgi:phage shock protein A